MAPIKVDPNYIKNLLPIEMQGLVGESSQWQQINVGRSGDSCFRVPLKGGGAGFLKTHASSTKDYFEYEIQALSWLNQFVSTCEMLANGRNRFHSFLLTRALLGKDLAHWIGELSADVIVSLCAQSMRALHSIPVEMCALNQRLEFKVAKAKDLLLKGQVDLSDLDSIRAGWSGEKLLSELERAIPQTEDLVVTHGDFCLPNLIADGRIFSGFIDLGRAGVADRYQDIALCLNSLKYNLGKDVSEQFVEEYGFIKEIDEDKVRFYRLLDEFF